MSPVPPGRVVRVRPSVAIGAAVGLGVSGDGVGTSGDGMEDGMEVDGDGSAIGLLEPESLLMTTTASVATSATASTPPTTAAIRPPRPDLRCGAAGAPGPL